MNYKKCSKCNVTKDINCFSTRKANKDGYKGHCKDCINEEARIRNKREDVKDKRRKYLQIEHIRKKHLERRINWGRNNIEK